MQISNTIPDHELDTLLNLIPESFKARRSGTLMKTLSA